MFFQFFMNTLLMLCHKIMRQISNDTMLYGNETISQYKIARWQDFVNIYRILEQYDGRERQGVRPVAYRVNIVEDELHLNNILTAYLKKEGHQVASFRTGQTATAQIAADVDVWIIDIMLPDTNGYTLFNEIRQQTPDVLAIFMSARNKEIDRVIGLEMGCDDYISKPFLPQELVLRVRKLLQSRERQSAQSVMQLAEYRICLDRRKVFAACEEIELSTKEYELLLFFARNGEIAVVRDCILTQVWGVDYVGSDRVVDDTVRRLRKKMPALDIETIYGYGYRFRSEVRR
jgi:two-component system, OmpR family, response regulator CssR